MRHDVHPGMPASEIKAAIEALPAGALVCFAPGRYEFGDTTITPPSGARVRGSGGSVVLRKTTTAVAGFKSPFFDCIDTVGADFDGLIFDKDTDCPREHAIFFRATTLGATGDVVVRNCEFRRCGIYVERFVDGFVIERNVLLGHGAEVGGSLGGIITGGQIIDGTGTNTDGVVQNGVIRFNRIAEQQSEAIDINWDTQNVLIAFNEFYNNDCGPDGIGGSNEVIDIGGGNCSGISVIGNTIIQDADAPNYTSGIHVKQGTARTIIADNIVHQENIPPTPVGAERHYGIYVDGVPGAIVRGNRVDGFHRGIGASGPIATLTISQNKVTKNRLDEILLAGTAGNLIIDVTVSDNEIGDSTTLTEEALDMEYVIRAQVTGNRIRGASNQACVRVRANCQNVSVVGNPRISQSRFGVQLDAGSIGTRVSGNTILNCGRNGIVFGGACTDYFIQDNTILDVNSELGGHYAITFQGDDGTVTGNTIRDSRATDETKTTQNGISVTGPSDGCWFAGNKIRAVKSGGTSFSGLANLTNPVT